MVPTAKPTADFHRLAVIHAGHTVIGAALVACAGIGLFVYFKMHDRFGGAGYDDGRNFNYSKEGTYGTAVWMSDKEMRSVLEVAPPKAAQGNILGEKNGDVICLPVDTRLNKNMFVCGAPGTMKSRAVVRNLIFQSVRRGESVILTDPKGELYDDTSELFRRNGYQVKVFNLVNPQHSDSWNCMAGLDGDTLVAQILADVMISNTSKGKLDHFWDNGETNLLKSLILYIDQDTSRGPEYKHLPGVYKMLTENTPQKLTAIFERLPTTHPAKAPYSLFSQASENVRSGIILGLGTRLQILQSRAIQQVATRPDIGLAEPGRSKCAYFVILSDQESSTEFLSSLFFSFLFMNLTRYADGTPEMRCKVPVNVIFEEFNNVGRLDSYPRRLSVIRSRAIQVCHIVQSLAQFQNRYPDNEWSEIIGNCDTQIMLGVTEKEGAEFFSMRSGDSTVQVKSTATTRQTIALAQVIPQYRETDGIGRRRLLTPDEILRFPNEELLIIIRGQNVLRARKFDYTHHPYAMELVKSSIFEYSPSGAPLPPGDERPEEKIPAAGAGLPDGKDISAGDGGHRPEIHVESGILKKDAQPLDPGVSGGPIKLFGPTGAKAPEPKPKMGSPAAGAKPESAKQQASPRLYGSAEQLKESAEPPMGF